MVRRGSTVRVRQRARERPANAGLSPSRASGFDVQSRPGQPLVNLRPHREAKRGRLGDVLAPGLSVTARRDVAAPPRLLVVPVSAAPSFGGIPDSGRKVPKLCRKALARIPPPSPARTVASSI